MDVNNINFYLHDEAATLALFKLIEQSDPQLAKQCAIVMESLAKGRGENTPPRGAMPAQPAKPAAIADAMPATDDSISLAQAVNDFNKRYHATAAAAKQTDLTVDAVLAAIRSAMLDRPNLSVTNATFAALGHVIETQVLPKEFELELLTGYEDDQTTRNVWSVRLRIPGTVIPNGTTCISIHEQLLSTHIIGEEERKVIHAWREKERKQGGISSFERAEWGSKEREERDAAAAIDAGEKPAATDSPRKVVAEFLRRLKAENEKRIDVQEVWALTTRSTNVSWGGDLLKMLEEDLIHPVHQLGNDEQTLVLSAPFDYLGRKRIFSAILLKRDGKWLLDRHDAFRSPEEVISLMEGFMLNAGVKFDVQAAELTGVWHFPCASTLTFFADGTGVLVAEGPSGVPEKSERFRWDVSGSTLRTHWPDHTDMETITWVTDNDLRVVDAKGQDHYFGDRTEAIPPGAAHELVVNDPRLTEKATHCFSIDADRQRMLYNEDLTPKLDVADPHQTDVSLIEWMKQHRMDAIGRVVPSTDAKAVQFGLRTFEMLAILAEADAWDKATAKQVTEKIKARLADWSFIGQVNDVLTDGKAPATFFFQTREGSQGLLQIIGPDENNGVKIRYKVTKEER
jgi:hypothetical protein